MTSALALNLTAALIALAVFQQSIELFFVRPLSWTLIESEMPRAFKFLLRRLPLVLTVNISAAIALPFTLSPSPALICLGATWLIALRWRGLFNGGSDQMTFFVLLALLISRLSPKQNDFACEMIAVLSLLSYVVAGLAKLSEREWRTGRAPARFLDWASLKDGVTGKMCAWAVIAFELACPLALVTPGTTIPWLIGGALFHLFNAYALGLNRFFFAWMATYPALYWASQQIQAR